MAEPLIRVALPCLCAVAASIAILGGATAALAGGQGAGPAVADPTAPAPGYGPAAAPGDAQRAAAGSPPEANRLQMILVQGEKRSAIFGGKTMHVGDHLELDGASARIERIDEGALVLRQGGATKVLPLIEDSAAVRRNKDCSEKSAGASTCRTR